MKKWKPTAAEKRAIRAFAALSEGRKPGQVHIEIGTRYNVDDGSIQPNDNVLIVRNGAEDARTDLYDTSPWSDLDKGVDLTEDGRVEVDFYVYERGFRGDHGDLLTNVQAHVETIDGRPRLVKLTGTLVPDASDYLVHAFSRHVASRTATESRAIADWSRQKRAMW